MKVEIELKSAALSGDIYELRKYLEENLEGLRLEIKTQQAPEGQMLIEAIGIGILHGVLEVAGKYSAKIILEKGKKMIRLIQDWNKGNGGTDAERGPSQPLGPGVSLDTGDERYYVTEDENGNIHAFDSFNYAIDTEHTHALLIGVSEFESEFPPIPPIRNNLVDFYNLLVDKRHIGLPRQNVKVAFNKTDHEIQEMMLGTSRIPGMETMILYYSGHGHKSDVKSLTLTARNTKKIADVIVGGIDLNFITDKILRPSTASQKIFILDACHSGIAAQGDDEIVRLIDVKGTYTLTSSGDEASYFDKRAQNTYFTGALLELLRKGTDDRAKEMLSLEDIYKLSAAKLEAERFPRPNSKNELNIPAADFFLARNPSFSSDTLKQKAARLMKMGKLQEAMHEYIVLLQRYPEDTQLKKEADECRDHLAFSQLVDEGDQLYFNARDYGKASEKYKRALEIKDDVTVAGRIGKCEDFLKLGSHQQKKDITPKPAKITRDPVEKVKEQMPKPGEKRVSGTAGLSREKKEAQVTIVHPSPPSELARRAFEKKSTWIIIALSWFLGSIIFHVVKLSDIDSYKIAFNRVSVPILIITAFLIGIRNKKISTTEILIYITGSLPAFFLIIVSLTDKDPSLARAIIPHSILAIAYFIYFRTALRRFSLLDFVISCIPLLYFITLLFVILIFMLFVKAWTDDVTGPVSLTASGITTAITIFFSYGIWEKQKQTDH